MRKLLLALVAGAALGTGAMVGAAQATPVNASGAIQSTAGQVGAVEQVRTVCNQWGRCWWVPNYNAYGYGFYRPGPRLYFGGPRYRYRRW